MTSADEDIKRDLASHLEDDLLLSDSLPLPGFIGYQNKGSQRYGIYVKNTYIKDGKVSHDTMYLGKVINIDDGIFHSLKRGYFTFSLENGFGTVPDLNHPSILNIPSNKVLNFGDIWMVDQIFKKSGLEKVFENLMPESRDSDTLKALVGYRLLEKDAYCYAEDWYRKSYANVLYPLARLESPRISDFHAILGGEGNYRRFFRSYLEIITKNKNINDQISIPILIDSTGLQNDIKTHLTAVNNHNGVVNNEIRLIYVIDKNTKMPIYFRYVPGNIIDDSTLITTVNMLMAYNINIEMIIMDAGYYSLNNLTQLTNNNISFITRVNKNRKEFKTLMAEYGADLENARNGFSYGDRIFCGKKVPIFLFGKELYAYIILDFHKEYEDKVHCFHKYIDDPDKTSIIDNNLLTAGKFILLSSNNYDIKEILPLYYTRQAIEQTFDISKTYGGLLPLRGHSEETLRGILLISFLATTVYSYINYGLSNSKHSAHSALKFMHNLSIKIYSSITLLEDLTKQQKEIFGHLNLDCPFGLESGNPLQKNSLGSGVERKKRGRPKGRKNKKTTGISEFNQNPERKRPRGRPKGSKNKATKVLTDEVPQKCEGRRSRGRPKGSKNKVGKILSSNITHNSTEKRSRGRPKGSKNKVI
jgi:hypothetical protein